MAKLRLQLGAQRWALPLRKLDGDDADGPKRVHLDAADGAPVRRGWRLADRLLDPEETASVYRCDAGLTHARADLRRVYAATGQPVAEHASTLGTHQVLEPAAPEDLLEHVIESVYELGAADGDSSEPAPLELAAPAALHACPFVYRRGIVVRRAHVLASAAAGGRLVALVGVRHRLPWVEGPGDLPTRRLAAAHIDGAPAGARLAWQTARAGEDAALAWVTTDGRPVASVRVERATGEEVPEDAPVAWLREDGEPARRVVTRQRTASGDVVEVEERAPTVGAGAPLALGRAGDAIPADALVRAHVLRGARQLRHLDAAGYRWLRAIAEVLAGDGERLRPAGAGPGGREPIVWQAGGRPWRGWLRGEVDGERYRVVLHLSAP